MKFYSKPRSSKNPHIFSGFWNIKTRLLILSFALLLVGCSPGDEEVLTEQNFDPEDLAPFVEPEFPFITTSVDVRELGPGFPDDNITPRCLAVRLGSEAYACFDTDMLRWSVAWTGDFLPMVTMGQISYRDFHNKDNEIPRIAGSPKIATGLYPGWMGEHPKFSDPRPPAPNPEGPSWGPLPLELGRWNGIYVNDREVVLSYTAQNTTIYEKPGSIQSGDVTAFTRTFQVENPEKALSLAAAEVSNGARSEVSGSTAFLYHGPEEDMVTAIGLVGSATEVELEVTEDQYVTVAVSPADETVEFTVVLWKGLTDQIDTFNQLLSEAEINVNIAEFKNGGPAYWPDQVHTRGQLAPDTSAFVVDRLTLPIPNPWKRNVRVVDISFFDDHRAALVTFEGDVWIVDGIDRDLETLEWQRFASGMYEPQSIEVVDAKVYVFGKEGITKLHDLNGDGSADYYENFSNLMEQSIETREWASDMVRAPDGSFYVSKFGALNAGPETSSPQTIMGFRAGSWYGGTIAKISPDGHNIERYASGFRGPYLGIHPETGMLTASDQQGNFVPSTPLLLVEEGDYFGVPATAYQDPLPEITPPLMWIPHSVDRSGMGQVWITSNQMGPLNGKLIHLSYGRPGLFKVLIDSTSEAVQGGVSAIPGNYPAPTMKGAIGPDDGQLYVAGFSLWGSNSDVISSLIRLRYTGQQSPLPEDFSVREGGVILRFGTELDEKTATNPANYQVKRWNYERTEEYGSGHFKLDGSPGEELIPVFSAHLSEDNRSVFITIPDIQEVMQMEIDYNLETSGGVAMNDEFWFTVNDVEQPNLVDEGFGELNVDQLLQDSNRQMTAQQEEEPVSVKRGKELFQRTGCFACHSVDKTEAGKVGPPIHGLFGSERNLEDGSSVVANEEYLRRSILEPGQDVVAGYPAEMPSFLGILNEKEIESIILYLKSLSE